MLEFIKEVAREAGAICLTRQQTLTASDMSFKGVRDLVTTADKEVEAFVVGRILEKFPNDSIIAEEENSREGTGKGTWVIDPIDGTVSFFCGQPCYSVSIAYMEDDLIQAGVVYAPALGQLFSAQRGCGAYLNDTQKLQVSGLNAMINAVFATGFACLRAGLEPNNLLYLNRILPQIRDMRRCGSAAIDLAYTAAGKVDGFWEMQLNLYDVAAGVLLVEEAGGQIFDMQGGKAYPEAGIVAGNAFVCKQLLENFRAAEK